MLVASDKSIYKIDAYGLRYGCLGSRSAFPNLVLAEPLAVRVFAPFQLHTGCRVVFLKLNVDIFAYIFP